MDLARLKQETSAEHDGTEESVPLMSESLTRESYADVLRCFYRIVSAWDRWADEHVPADLQQLLAGRRRATLLADDLRSLGQSELPPDSEVPNEAMWFTAVPGDARSVFLGRMYVMEGSTLGGQYIARHVEEKLGLERGVGDSFFVGYAEQTGARWREFKAVLADLPESEADTVIASAKNMFALFGESMRSGVAAGK